MFRALLERIRERGNCLQGIIRRPAACRVVRFLPAMQKQPPISRRIRSSNRQPQQLLRRHHQSRNADADEPQRAGHQTMPC